VTRVIAADLRVRLIALFLAGPGGRRPCFGPAARLPAHSIAAGNSTRTAIAFTIARFLAELAGVRRNPPHPPRK